MPTIESMTPIGVPDHNGNRNYTLEITPDDGKPGKGDVSDTSNHSADWNSVDGNTVPVVIFGKPPFQARQIKVTFSAPIGHNDAH